MMQKLQRAIVGVLLTIFLAIGFSTPVYAQSQQSLEPTGYLFRINVSSADNALTFYQDILGMKLDKEQSVCSASYCWLEFLAPGGKVNVKIGTEVNTLQGTGKAVITILVNDVDEAKAYLEAKGIKVSDILNVGKKVRLAFFTDYDGNRLAIRDEKGPE
jgi:predicted enzyme related to lactoylglutathione lyase